MRKFQNEAKSVWLKYIRVFLSSISGFILSIIFVKYFSIEEFGTYSFIISLNTTILIITSLGLTLTLIRFIPEYLHLKNYRSINILIKYSLLFRSLALFIFFSLIIVFSKQFSNYFNHSRLFENLISMIIIYISTNSIITLLRSIFYTSYSREYINDYIEVFKILAITIVVLMLLSSGLGLKSIILSYVFINLFILIIVLKHGFEIVRQNNNWIRGQTVTTFEKKRVFKYGAFNFLSGTAGFLRDTSIDIFVISYYLNVEKVGFYALGVTVALYLNKINPSETLKNLFYPVIFKEYTKSNEDINVLIKYSLFLSKFTIFTVMPFLAIIFIFSKEIIEYIYNPKYIESILVIQILAGFYIFRIFIRSYKVMFHSLEKNKFIFISSLLGIVNFLLSIIFIKLWGIAGVAFSTGLTWAINLVMFVFVSWFQLKISFPILNKSMLKLVINILIHIIILVLLKNLIGGLLSLLGICSISLLLYFIISRLNKCFTAEERSFINSVAGFKIWKF